MSLGTLIDIGTVMDHVKTDTAHMSTALPLDVKYSDTQKLYCQHLLEKLASVDVVASKASAQKVSFCILQALCSTNARVKTDTYTFSLLTHCFC